MFVSHPREKMSEQPCAFALPPKLDTVGMDPTVPAAGSKGEVVHSRRFTDTYVDPLLSTLLPLTLLAASQVTIDLGALDVKMGDGPSANHLSAAHVAVLPLELPFGEGELIEWESIMELGESNRVARVSLRMKNDLETLQRSKFLELVANILHGTVRTRLHLLVEILKEVLGYMNRGLLRKLDGDKDSPSESSEVRAEPIHHINDLHRFIIAKFIKLLLSTAPVAMSAVEGVNINNDLNPVADPEGRSFLWSHLADFNLKIVVSIRVVTRINETDVSRRITHLVQADDVVSNAVILDDYIFQALILTCIKCTDELGVPLGWL